MSALTLYWWGFADWFSNVILADPTTHGHDSYQHGVECMIFADPKDLDPNQLLPTPSCIGGVIRLHRIKVSSVLQ